MSENLGETAQIDAQVHFPGTPEHHGVADLTAYWNRKRGDRRMPDRQDILPSEIVKLLPNLHITEVLDGGKDFRIRLFGTALVNFLGAEMTGKRLSDLGRLSPVVTDAEAARRRWTDISGRAYKNICPVFATGYFVNTVHRHIRWHAVSAPLTAGGGEIAQMLGGLFFVEQR
jgi:hypothetical protein